MTIKRIYWCIFNLAMLLVIACSDVMANTDIVKEGKASWIGERFQGKKTASGELFDLNDLTGSHATLPFGSKVKVTSKRTGKSVVVRINNRSEIDNGRVIDVSRRAAEQIGLIEEGVGLVSLDVVQLASSYSPVNTSVNKDPAQTLPVSNTNKVDSIDNDGVKYQIQFASFFDLENAVEFKNELKKKNIETTLESAMGSSGKTIYRVNSSQKYLSKEQAKEALSAYAPQEGLVLPFKDASTASSNSTNLKQAKAGVNENKATPIKSTVYEYGAQFGAFETVNNAQEMQSKLLTEKGIKTIIHQFPDDDKRLYRVLTNRPFVSKEEAEKFLNQHKLQGIILTFVK